MAKVSLKTITAEQRQAAFEKGISLTTIRNRLSRGWSAEDAIGESVKSKGGRNDKSKMVNVDTDGKKEMESYPSESFFAGPRQMLGCPVEGCNHVGLVITKAHCRIEHGLERNEVVSKYGMPNVLTFDPSKMPREQSYFVGNSLK